jgi:predicted TIM-barrel fold metal-dependent hydrolase
VLTPDTPAAELARLHALGVRAIRLNLVGTDHNLSAWQGPHAPWPHLAARGWHVELHTDRGALPAALAQLPADLPLVIDHMGKPDAAHPHDPTVRALARRAQHTPVHVTLSGAYRLGGLEAGTLARLWRDELGPRALLWGSDWPCTNHEAEADIPRLRAALDTWLPDPAERHAVLVDNPGRVYWGETGG